jgi:hypothetical protein
MASKLLITANDVPSALILFVLMMKAIGSSGTSVLTRATRRHIPEDVVLHNHLRENIISYIIGFLSVVTFVSPNFLF